MQILTGLLETGIGALAGVAIESVFSSADPGAPFESEVFEAAAQLGLNALVIPATGAFIVRRIDPNNSTAGFLLFWGLSTAQPNLHAKLRRINAEFRLGLLGAIDKNAGIELKSKPPKHPHAQ